jgi:hypothetical protein
MSAHRENLRAAIDRYAALERGWLDGEGEAIDPSAIAFARQWLDEETDAELARWVVFPRESGEVGFERVYEDERRDSVWVGAERIAYFVCANLRGWSAWIEVDREPPHTLRECAVGDR